MTSGTYLLTLIFGAAALLLWGIRMARTSVMRAHGPQIRRLVPKVLGNRWLALATGLGAAAVLQSSTAVAVFIASLASLGVVPVAGGLAVMLGADVGSAVVAALLTLNVKGLWPVLIFAGYLVHTFYGETNSRAKQYGRFALGLGLVMIALVFMAQASGALADSAVIRQVVSSLADEPLLAVLVLAALTWLAHSSIAILLFLSSLVGTGIIPEHAPLLGAAVLGINIGGGLPAIVLTWRQAPAARRIALGNWLFRLLGAAAGLVGLTQVSALYEMLPGSPGFRVILLHILFNCALTALFIWFVEPFARLLEKLIPTPASAAVEEYGPRYIPQMPGAFQAQLPLAALSRETLRMSDVIQSMLSQTLEVLCAGCYSAEKVMQIRRLDDRVDTLYKAIRRYAIDLTRSDLPDHELRRITGLLRYAANLENVGDIIDKSLLDITSHKNKSKRSFSDDGNAEMKELFDYVSVTMQTSAAVVMGWRADIAESLLARKREFKGIVRQSSERHIERLRQGVSNSLETSSYHMNIINDLQRINALVSSIAYDVAVTGDLRENSL